MKAALSFVVVLFVCSTVYAQKTLTPEFFGGVNMMRPRERMFSQGWNNDINITGITAQLGYQYGANFRFKERRFSPIFGLCFSRNISYATLTQRISSNIISSSYQEINVNYLRWDIGTADLNMGFEASLGKEYNIRWVGGITFSSLLLNRSRINYWLYETRNVYDPATMTYSQMSIAEYKEDRLRMRQITSSLFGGIVLPVYGTKWSISAMWRYGISDGDQMFGLSSRGMSLSAVYSLK
jgi:hypothetical protein